MLQCVKPPDDLRDRHRAYILRVIEETQTPPTTLAGHVGVSASTLTRALNDPEHKNAFSARTIAKIEKFSGIPFSDAPRPRVLREPEAQAYDLGVVTTNYDAVLQAALEGSNSRTVWTLRSRALENIGYVPGDILIVDLNEPPRRGDIVCAQIYDFQRMKADTVFRLYEPPFLIAATHDRALTVPRLVDKEVGIKGPVLLSFRGRASAA